MNDFDLDLQNCTKIVVNITIESQQVTLYLVAIVMHVRSFTVWEIIKYELLKCSRFEPLIFKKRKLRSLGGKSRNMSLDDKLYGL